LGLSRRPHRATRRHRRQGAELRDPHRGGLEDQERGLPHPPLGPANRRRDRSPPAQAGRV